MIAVEVVIQAVLIGSACLLVVRLESGHVLVARVLEVLALAAGLAASILLVVASWVSANARSARVAAAVGVYTGVALLAQAIEIDLRDGMWPLAVGVAVFAVVGLLVMAVSSTSGSRRDQVIVAALIAMVVVGVATAGVIDALLPEYVVPRALLSTADLIAWSGAGAAGLVLLVGGVFADRPVLRRVGLAFVTLAVGHGTRIGSELPPGVDPGPLVGALELAGVAMFLVAAVPALLSAVLTVWSQQEASRTRLAEAEAAMASVTERDHEMRNLVAGLSGAARVLSVDGVSPDGRRLLLAAGAELERLQRMLQREGQRPPLRDESAVGPLLSDLAAMHRAGGLVVDLDIVGDPRVAMDHAALAQIVANLLVNCARHAPGAQVWLRAGSADGRVRIEVADDGPGLPPGAAEDLLRRGSRGPGSTGSGLGLAITAALVGEHDGTFTLVSGGRGCTAVIDLPSARLGAPTAERVGA